MEILYFVIAHRPGKAALLLATATLCVIAGFAALFSFPGETPVSESPVRAASYIASCCICIGISSQWISGSRSFLKLLKTPFDIYGGACSKMDGYRSALEMYSKNCHLFDSPFPNSRTAEGFRSCEIENAMKRPDGKQSEYLKRCKATFWMLWIGFMAIEAAALAETAVPIVPKIYLISLAIIATLLNGTSYLLCCIYVRFLDSFSKIGNLEEFDHNRHSPIRTPEYERLDNAARNNLRTFLLVSLQFSLVVMLCAFLLPSDKPIGFLPIACFMSVILIGFATFAVLSIYSRIALNEITDRWKKRSISEIDEKYRSIVSRDGAGIVETSDEADKCLKAYRTVLETSRWSKLDSLNVALTVASLTVNVATFFLAIVKG